jgi:hypothetical protein
MGNDPQRLSNIDVSENGTALPPHRNFVSITVGIISKLRIAAKKRPLRDLLPKKFSRKANDGTKLTLSRNYRDRFFDKFGKL